MRSSTITLALSLLAAAVSVSVSGSYTNGNDFFDDLPTCIRDCSADIISALKEQCDSASNNLECVCTVSDSMTASSSSASACTRACSEDDMSDFIKVSLEMASSCVPYLADEGANNSTSSTVSSMSGMTTATISGMMASSTGGSSNSGSSSSSGSMTATTTTGTGTATETPSSTASNSPAQTGAAAGRAAWVGSLLLLVAAPAALLVI